jgi:hypothetical protein
LCKIETRIDHRMVRTKVLMQKNTFFSCGTRFATTKKEKADAESGVNFKKEKTMGDWENKLLSERIDRLAGDCVVDREDAWMISEAAILADRTSQTRARLADLMRACAPSMEPEAFATLKAALQGELSGCEKRTLLKMGDRGETVARLREALSNVAFLHADKRMDPGKGTTLDARTAACLREFQGRFGLPASGVLDSQTLLVMNRLLEQIDRPMLDVELLSKPPRGIVLHFYPGDESRTLVVMQGDQVLDSYGMRGGPEKTRTDDRPANATRMNFSPTPAGRYRIAGMGRHTTAAWKYSQIPWGSAIREQDGVIQFQKSPGGSWFDATGEKSVFRDRPKDVQFSREDFIEGGKVAGEYRDNDFGHRAVYLERDGVRQGHMIHATPNEERRYGDDDVPLLESHGCEHMLPADLDEAVSKGYFRAGTTFFVHGYDEVPGTPN